MTPEQRGLVAAGLRRTEPPDLDAPRSPDLGQGPPSSERDLLDAYGVTNGLLEDERLPRAIGEIAVTRHATLGVRLDDLRRPPAPTSGPRGWVPVREVLRHEPRLVEVRPGNRRGSRA